MFQYNKKDSASPNHQRFFKVDTYLGSECLKGYLTSRKKKKKPKNEKFGCTNRRHESQKRIEEIEKKEKEYREYKLSQLSMRWAVAKARRRIIERESGLDVVLKKLEGARFGKVLLEESLLRKEIKRRGVKCRHSRMGYDYLINKERRL